MKILFVIFLQSFTKVLYVRIADILPELSQKCYRYISQFLWNISHFSWNISKIYLKTFDAIWEIEVKQTYFYFISTYCIVCSESATIKTDLQYSLKYLLPRERFFDFIINPHNFFEYMNLKNSLNDKESEIECVEFLITSTSLVENMCI